MANASSNTFQKVKLISFTVVVGALLLIWQGLGKSISVPFQLVFLSVCLLLTGIPHGALDHLVEQEQSKRQNGRFHLLFFLSQYVVMMLLYALAWYIFPQLSLFFFLLISCWHFGETDIDLMSHRLIINAMLRMLYGISILIWLLLAHHTEVSLILLHMVKQESLIYHQWLAMTLQSYWLIPASGIAILTLLIFTTVEDHGDRYHHWLVLQLIIILLCGYKLPLLPAFALYFAGWHSLVTLFNIKGFIINDVATHNKPFINLWLKALPFGLIAISGLIAAGYLLRHYAPLFDPLPLLFVFLSLITLPHMAVMHKLNSSIKA